jgi:Putative transposase
VRQVLEAWLADGVWAPEQRARHLCLLPDLSDERAGDHPGRLRRPGGKSRAMRRVSSTRTSASSRAQTGSVTPAGGGRGRHRPLPSAARASTPELRVNAHGFSLHVALRWRADQRLELEQLCRYITRPAIANERLKRNRAGQVVLQLKSPYKDGTTHIVMEPLEFMERLAALVPRPRLHLIPFDRLRAGHFHGVLAPNAKLRSKIVPAPASPATESPSENAHGQGAPARTSWARLLKRVFDIGIEHCPNCGGKLEDHRRPFGTLLCGCQAHYTRGLFFLLVFMTFLLPDQRETCCYTWHGTRPSH